MEVTDLCALKLIEKSDLKLPINKLMFNVMKSEILIKEAEIRLETAIKYKNNCYGLFDTKLKLEQRVISLEEVLSRVEQYKNRNLLKLSEHIRYIIPIEYKF